MLIFSFFAGGITTVSASVLRSRLEMSLKNLKCILSSQVDLTHFSFLTSVILSNQYFSSTIDSSNTYGPEVI